MVCHEILQAYALLLIKLHVLRHGHWPAEVETPLRITHVIFNVASISIL